MDKTIIPRARNRALYDLKEARAWPHSAGQFLTQDIAFPAPRFGRQ